MLLKSVHALPLIFTETDFYSYFFFSFAWDCTKGIEMDYLGLQLHNIQREEQLESEIQKMKRHQHDQLDLPAIFYNSMCCVQNTEQQWGSRCDCQLECTVEVVPLLFHVSVPCFLSTSICALFSVCAMQSLGEGTSFGYSCTPHLGQLHHSHSWVPLWCSHRNALKIRTA